MLVPGRLPLAGRRVTGGPLAVELAERREGSRAVDRGRATVHQEGNADRLGGLWRGGAMLDGGVGVGGDAAVAFLADRDRQRDELLGPGVQGPGRQRRIVQFLIARVDRRDRVPQFSRRHPQLVAHSLSVTHDLSPFRWLSRYPQEYRIHGSPTTAIGPVPAARQDHAVCDRRGLAVSDRARRRTR